MPWTTAALRDPHGCPELWKPSLLHSLFVPFPLTLSEPLCLFDACLVKPTSGVGGIIDGAHDILALTFAFGLAGLVLVLAGLALALAGLRGGWVDPYRRGKYGHARIYTKRD